MDFVHRKPVLEKTLEFLSRLPPYRIAVLYGYHSLDSLVTIPALGWTFQAVKGISARYFCMDHYFPLFMEAFGKKVPRVLMLNYQGLGVSFWGPRPDDVTARLDGRTWSGAREADRDFLSLVDDIYPQALDQSFLKRLCLEFGDTVPME